MPRMSQLITSTLRRSTVARTLPRGGLGAGCRPWQQKQPGGPGRLAGLWLRGVSRAGWQGPGAADPSSSSLSWTSRHWPSSPFPNPLPGAGDSWCEALGEAA